MVNYNNSILFSGDTLFKMSIGREDLPSSCPRYRENSLDSRDYGLVDRKEIVGRAWIRIWPFSQVKVFWKVSKSVDKKA